jgi:hypothetical protein
MEDNLNFFKMEDDLNFLSKGRWPQLFQLEDDLTFFQMEDNLDLHRKRKISFVLIQRWV